MLSVSVLASICTLCRSFMSSPCKFYNFVSLNIGPARPLSCLPEVASSAYEDREGKDLNIFESICLKKGENRLNQCRSALRLHHIRHISHIRSAQQQTLTLHRQGCNLHHRKHRDLEIVHPRAKPATSPSTIVFEPKLDRITETTGPTDRTRSSQRRQIRRVCLNAIFAKASNPNVTNVSVIAIVDDFVESNQSFLGSGIRLGLEPRRETVGGGFL